MPSITVRDIPDKTRDELAVRAARSGRSLQEFLRLTLIDLAERPDPATVAARIHERKRTLRSSLPAASILAHRDDDRA